MKHLISIIGLGALYALTALFLIYSYHYITKWSGYNHSLSLSNLCQLLNGSIL